MLDKVDLDAALESVQTKYDEYKPANKWKFSQEMS